MNTEMAVTFAAKTDGKGYWSRSKRIVQIRKLEIYLADDGKKQGMPLNIQYGNLNAYFTKSSWNTEKHGLIYTDKLWMKTFREELHMAGFSHKAAMDVIYSEQGMQGEDFVNMDVGKTFITEWMSLND
jgi:hypothetical protein